MIVNNGLGNGFVINAVDSSVSQEHYFTGAKKYLQLKNVGVTFTKATLLSSGTAFYGIDVDITGNLYVCGTKTVGGDEAWWTLKYDKITDTWIEIDLYTSVSGSGDSVALDIRVDPRDNDIIYACGRHASGTTDVPVQGIVRRSLDKGQTWDLNFAVQSRVINATSASTTTASGDWGSTLREVDFYFSASQDQSHTASYSTAWFVGERRSGSSYDTSDFANTAWTPIVTRTANAGAEYQTGSFITDAIDWGFYDHGVTETNKRAYRTIAHDNLTSDFKAVTDQQIAVGGFVSSSLSGGFFGSAQQHYQNKAKLTPASGNGDFDLGLYSMQISTTGSLWAAGSLFLSSSQSRYATIHHRHQLPENNFTGEFHTADTFPTASVLNFGHNVYTKLLVDGMGHVPYSGSIPDGTDGTANLLEQSGSFQYYALGAFTASYQDGGNDASLLIRKSPDAGHSWYTIESSYSSVGPNILYDGVVHGGVLYVCGAFSGSGVVYRYEDAGVNNFTLGAADVIEHVELHTRLFDDSGFVVDTTGTVASELFGYVSPANTELLSFVNGLSSYVPLDVPNTGSVYEAFQPTLTFEVSASNFSPDNVVVEFKDKDLGYTDIRPYGSYVLQSDGYHKFSSRLGIGGTRYIPKFAFNKNFPIFRVSAMSGAHVFREFGVNFIQPLTDEGVRKLQDIDNQNIEENNVNLGLLPLHGLNGLSEYPHSNGLFQMENLVLGTTYSGQIGRDDDSIIQVNYLGSVVKVMWPRQDDQNIIVKGFGDVAPGQRPGKLLDSFDPGEFFEVTEFDHMTLYCYLTKELSGTLDNIDVKIERRPLRSTGFATDQSVEYETSGSTTIAKLRDIVYRKEIDYGDLSISEIGYPIDVPLTNVREVRVSAKQLTGQDDDRNKNFIVWGRFINSDEET